MSDRPTVHPAQTDTKQLAREQRRARLASELRSNLRKRKEQARGRSLPRSDSETDQPDAREAAISPTGEVA